MDLEKALEIKKCYESIEYFIDNYVYFRNDASGKKFKPVLGHTPEEKYYYQRVVVKNFEEGKNQLLWKTRRAGASWIVAAIYSHQWAFHQNKNLLMVSRADKQAKSLLRKVKFIIKNLPSYMIPEIGIDNMNVISSVWRNTDGSVNNHTYVESLTSNPNSSVGEGASLIFIDEFAKIEHDEELWRTILPTITGGGQWIGASTPDMKGTTFRRLVLQAQTPEFIKQENKPYELITIDRSQYNIDEDEFQKMVSVSTKDDIAQEWELKFLQTGDSVFNENDLNICYQPGLNTEELMEQYEKAGNYYYIGVDTAVGKTNKKSSEKDYHSFIGITNTGVQVIAHHSQESITKWAGKMDRTSNGNFIYHKGTISKLHDKYKGKMLIEENGSGEVVLNNHVAPEDGYSTVNRFNTNAKTKPRIIRQLIQAIESHQVIITDHFLYLCLLHYVHGTGQNQYQADSGFNDDPIIALALAWEELLYEGGYNMDSMTLITKENYKAHSDNNLIHTGQPILVGSQNEYKKAIEEMNNLPAPIDLPVDNRYLGI